MSNGKQRSVSASKHRPTRIAAKTLTQVEVDPKSSNQHELHGGTLRKLLGFQGRVAGQLRIMFYTEDDKDPVLDESGYTLYDAREDHPTRSEWHLYYKSRLVGQIAKPNDLLILARRDKEDDLTGIVARSGTRLEKKLREALSLQDTPVIERFLRLDASNFVQGELILEVAEPHSHGVTGDGTLGYSSHPLYVRSLQNSKLPTSKEMAEAAAMLVAKRFGQHLNPDDFLTASLDLESELFFAIEKGIGQQQLDDLVRMGAAFDDVLAFALSKHQARKARRGLSLQHHVASLLSAYGIPFTPQARTEGGETPDFIVPGERQYHDPRYPSDLIRMIGCKSRIRERWGQYLKEALKVAIKYHVSVDEDMSGEVLRKMNAHNLRTFMPKKFIDTYYAEELRQYISPLSELINELRSVTAGVNK